MMVERRFNHMLDVAFTIESTIEDWEQIPAKDLVEALQRRVNYLRDNPADAADAIGFSDSYEVPTEAASAIPDL